MGSLRNAAEVPFHAQVDVAWTSGILRSNRAENRQIRSIDIQLESVRQSVIEFEIGGVLAKIGILRGLQTIKFIKELKVQCSWGSDRRIICVEGQLGQQRFHAKYPG